MNNRGEGKQPKKPYSDWLDNKEALDKIKDLLETVGFPLEISARNKLESCGYLVSNSFYLQVDPKTGKTISIEIDVYANKNIHASEYQGCKIIFELTIIGECKYSSTDDYFGFQHENRPVDALFPIIFHLDFLQPRLSGYFSFPAIVHNVAEINTMYHNTLSHSIIYEACEQVNSAIEYFSDTRNSRQIWQEYLRVYREILPLLEKYRNENHPTASLIGNRIIYNSEVIKDFIDSTFTKEVLFAVLKQVRINIVIPIVVVGPNNGLLKVELRNGKVDRLTDSKYWAYIHTPRESRNQDEPLAVPKTFVVIVCNTNYLEKCLSVIEDGVKKTISQLIEQIMNSPHSILYEIYSRVSVPD
jgi:hypothetical protein